MKSIIIIPSRLESSRFPSKPFAIVNNKPLLEHCLVNAKKSKIVNKVIVATPNQEIFEFVKKIGGEVVLTNKKHNRASERCSEALNIIEKKYQIKFDIIGMLQGDEPLINSKNIDKALGYMKKNNKIPVVNLIKKINSNKELIDKNIIKVVKNKYNEALYFSRLPIPNYFKYDKDKYYKQVCFIPFRRKYLLKYLSLKPSVYEELESIDMLRFLENKINVSLVEIKNDVQSIDVRSDIKKAEKIFASLPTRY